MKVKLNTQIQGSLSRLKSRLRTANNAPALFGTVRTRDGIVPIVDYLSGRFDAMASSEVDSDKLADLIQKGLRGDEAAQTQLNGLRIETANNAIQASSNFLGFFEQVNLEEADRPIYQNETMQFVRVGYLSEDGTPQRTKIIKPQAETEIDLRFLSTDDVWYKVLDIYRGNVSRAAQATFDLALEMRMKMDKEAFTLMTAALGSGGVFGDFDLTNANKAKHVFRPHPNILLSNLPTSNDIVVDGTTAASPFRFEVFDAIVHYCSRWAGAFRDGELQPTGDIVLPSVDVDGFSKLIQPTGNTNNAVADQVMQQGWATIDYLGYKWRLIPDNTIASGTCYPKLNKPIGRAYYKPSMDRDVVNSTNEQIKANIESRYMSKVFGLFCPTNQRMNALRVTYRQPGQ